VALANDTATGIVFGSALVFTVSGFAWAAGQWLRALAGLVLGGAFFVSALVGVWNLYLYQDRANGSSIVAAAASATTTAKTRVDELEAERADVKAREAGTVATLQAQLARTADTATVTRRTLTQQILDVQAAAAAEQTRIARELARARAQSAMTAEQAADSVDRRPADAELAAATGLDRRLIGSMLDLKRSGMFELMALMFATLALAAAPLPAKARVAKADGGAEKALKILERFAGAGAFLGGVRMPWRKAAPDPAPDPIPDPDPVLNDPPALPAPEPRKRRGVRTLPEPTQAELEAAGLVAAPVNDPALAA
jgi:hypothetical protein